MVDDVMHAKLMEVVDILLFEPAEVDLGDVCQMVKYDLGIADDREVKRLTYEAVREMLHRAHWWISTAAAFRRASIIRKRRLTKSSRASTANGKPLKRCRPFREKSASSSGRRPQWKRTPEVVTSGRRDNGAW